MTSLIQTENLTFSYDRTDTSGGSPARPALNGVTLSIQKGSFVAVVGRNGSGKSTLAKNLNALLLPSGGTVFVDGMSVFDGEKLWDIRKTVGMVFQNPDNQLVSSVAEDDAAFGPENLGVPPDEIRKRVDEALKAVNMYEHRKKGPHLLSGGQKQRLAVAGVLAMQPSCVVLDEPTAMLDPSGRAEIMDIAEKLHQSGKTVILITHFMEEAARAERIIVLDDGQIVMDGAPRQIFSEAEKIRALGLQLPFAARLAAELREKGLPLPKGIISEKELEDQLCALM